MATTRFHFATLLQSVVLLMLLGAAISAAVDQTLRGVREIPSLAGVTDLRAIAKKIAPLVYLHTKDRFTPSSVSYFVSHVGDKKEALLGKEQHRFKASQKLATNFKNKGWLQGQKNPQGWPIYTYISAEASTWPCHQEGDRVHDIIYWAFYPFNGGKIIKKPTRTHLKKLGPSGDHVGDWEMVAQRVLIRDGKVSIISMQLSRHSSHLATIIAPQEGGLDWVNDAGVVTADGSHPVVYSAWQGHSFYPHAGCFVYAGQKVDVADIFNKALDIPSSAERVLSKVEVIDAQVFDFADKGKKWPTWKHVDFVAVNGEPMETHKWWWPRSEWMWGNAKGGQIKFIRLSLNPLDNKVLGKLAAKVCKKLPENHLLVSVICGLAMAPKAPIRQTTGIQAKFGDDTLCQPAKQWVGLTDRTKVNKLKQCKAGAEKTHGRDDGSSLLGKIKKPW